MCACVVYVTVCLLYIQCHKHTHTQTFVLPLPSRTRIKYTLRCTPQLKGLTYCTPTLTHTHTAHGCPCNSCCLIPNAFDGAAQCSPLPLSTITPPFSSLNPTQIPLHNPLLKVLFGCPCCLLPPPFSISPLPPVRTGNVGRYFLLLITFVRQLATLGKLS